MHRTSFVLLSALVAGACGGSPPPPAAPDPSTSVPSASASIDPAAASAMPGSTDSPASSAAPAASASSPSPAASAPPPVTTKLTKAQFDDATKFVMTAYKKKPFEAVLKEMTSRFGPPVDKSPPLYGWYGVDSNGKCFEFYVQKNNGEKWAGTSMLDTDAANCSK
jgi:hypothetical protein